MPLNILGRHNNESKGFVLLRETGSLSVGETFRFKISVDKDLLERDGALLGEELFLELRNTENPLLRPLWITGPYSLYADIVPFNFDERKKFKDETIQFVSDLKPDETFKARLLLNKNSRVGNTSEYSWTVDIISQFTVVTIASLPFDLSIATTDAILRTSSSERNMSLRPTKGFKYQKFDAEELWNLPPPFPDRPAHLVIITHGIFSSVGADMLFLRDSIERAGLEVSEDHNPNLMVRGFSGNIGKSHRGIRYLGTRVGKYVIETVDKLKTEFDLDKISFVGHSLGGPVQAMALHYIAVERPDIFDKDTGLEPINFIAAASPFLGVIGDFPKYISIPLDFGFFGQTGRDLNLKKSILKAAKGHIINDAFYQYKIKPILEVIPRSPALELFQRFKNRTLYANVAFDGIVPLRTSALLYLDWKALSDVRHVMHEVKSEDINDSASRTSEDLSTEEVEASVTMTGKIAKAGIIPEGFIDRKTFMRWLLPRVVINGKYKSYYRTQTKSIVDAPNFNGSDAKNPERVKKGDFKPPKKPSTIKSAASTLTAPLPSPEYICDPEKRKDKILHDKVYTPKELPEPHYRRKKALKKVIYPHYSIHAKEEKIARRWQETMTWRKVLVELQPDSHNNIIVRRRFVNAFGWVAVDHLAYEHFGYGSIESVKEEI